VTAGPGVTDAVTGVANAYQARSPLLLLGGAAPLKTKGMGALQEMPQVDMFRTFTKASFTIERTEDIPDLVRHFFSLAEKQGLPAKQIEIDALDRMRRYRWPGNVRELENLVRRLAALYPQDVITTAIMDIELSTPTPVVSDRAEEETLSGSVERHLAAYFGEFGGQLPPPGLYYRILRDIEYPLLSAALAATRGNQIKAAELLGLNRNTLRKKIRDLDIQVIRSSR